MFRKQRPTPREFPCLKDVPPGIQRVNYYYSHSYRFEYKRVPGSISGWITRMVSDEHTSTWAPVEVADLSMGMRLIECAEAPIAEVP